MLNNLKHLYLLRIVFTILMLMIETVRTKAHINCNSIQEGTDIVIPQ